MLSGPLSACMPRHTAVNEARRWWHYFARSLAHSLAPVCKLAMYEVCARQRPSQQADYSADDCLSLHCIQEMKTLLRMSRRVLLMPRHDSCENHYCERNSRVSTWLADTRRQLRLFLTYKSLYGCTAASTADHNPSKNVSSSVDIQQQTQHFLKKFIFFRKKHIRLE